MSDTNRPDDGSRQSFSLRTLLLFVTLATVFTGLTLALGPAALLLLPVAAVVYVGFLAYEADNPIPFWQCIGAILLILSLLSPVGSSNETDIIIISIFFGVACWLNYRSIIQGHIATKILGSIIAIPYVLTLAMAIINVITNHKQIINYWWP